MPNPIGSPARGRRLLDLSPEGAGVVLSPEADRLLGSAAELRIALSLGAETIELACSVRRRRATRAGILYGLRFEPTRSRDFARAQRIVAAYVLRCQQTRRHRRLRDRRAD